MARYAPKAKYIYWGENNPAVIGYLVASAEIHKEGA